MVAVQAVDSVPEAFQSDSRSLQILRLEMNPMTHSSIRRNQ
jgi:hypothetical protein